MWNEEMSKDLKQLTKRLKKQHGIKAVPRGHHTWLVGPKGDLICTISSTASDHRALLNIKADVRRAGYRV
jgi:hypothetical protein